MKAALGRLVVVAGVSVMAACSPAREDETASVASAVTEPFLAKDANQRLMFGSEPLAGPSANFFSLAEEYRRNPSTAQAKLTRLANQGIRFVRFWAAGMYDESARANLVVTDWKAQPATLDALYDRILLDAQPLGIKLIPSLVTGASNYHEALPGCPEFGVGNFMFPGSSNKADMKAFALRIVQRYKDSATILFWQLGNELNLSAKERDAAACVTRQQIRDYVAEMAAAVKAADPNHLFANGTIQEADPWPLSTITGNWNDQRDFYRYYNNVANVDIADFHSYGPWLDNAGVTSDAAKQIKYYRDLASGMSKTLWIGEAGLLPEGWPGNNLHNYAMSTLLASAYLGVQLTSVWTWESKEYRCWGGPDCHHPEFELFSLDPGEDDDYLAALAQVPYKLGRNQRQQWTPLIGDFDGNGRSDVGARSNRGQIQISTTTTAPAPNVPSQWIADFGDDLVDTGAAPFVAITGDFNGLGKSDVALKSKDGRWYLLESDGSKFVNQRQVLTNFGNDYADPGAAPFVPIAGDWNGDGKTDIALKAKDGRWFAADSDGTNFVNQRQILTSFGNDYVDLAAAPFRPIAGDFNKDGKTDLALKARDGRWFVVDSNGTAFVNQRQVLTNFGNDATDPGGAPFLPVAGDWDGDGRVDIGLKAKDGRWFIANSSGTTFINQRQVLTDFGNDYVDLAAAPFVPFVGKWNSDAKTDIGLKAADGRWFVATATTTGFAQSTWLN